ncbi:hypothetical protein GFY24_39800 [Nocardia sp. SYP-A9097]|uniref:hypothetical protein n=1 Tax=Nocardia sp. SYP-A9097 TaxID=2663237 RepID=UPI00129A8D09|nr:hypothetical protein [Nocardia sp. SYP-A9097]MRH93484.1 hypothetical protein [Nocardia sp. SYP-A9097]
MVIDSLPRRVLAELLGVGSYTHYAAWVPIGRNFPLRRRVIAELLGVMLREPLPSEADAPSETVTTPQVGPNDVSAEVTSISEARSFRLTMPGMHDWQLAAGTDDSGPVQVADHPELGLQVVHTITSSNEMLLAVTSDGTIAEVGDIIRILPTETDSSSGVLIILYPGREGEAVGQVVTSTMTMTEEFELTVLSPDELSDTLAVTAAVRASTAAGRNAWRLVAGALPHGHPIRSAVVDGLQ